MKSLQETVVSWGHDNAEQKGLYGIITNLPGLKLLSLEISKVPIPHPNIQIILKFWCVKNMDKKKLEDMLKNLQDANILGELLDQKIEPISQLSEFRQFIYTGKLIYPFCEKAVETGQRIHHTLGITDIDKIRRFEITQTTHIKVAGTWTSLADHLRGKISS